jgi:hypothetical protein
LSLTYYYQPTYKIEFWSGSTLLHGFGYGYTNKEVVSFRLKPGLTSAIGSFEVIIIDTGSDGFFTTGTAFSNLDIFNIVKFWYGYTGSGLTPSVATMFAGKIESKEVKFSENGISRTFIGTDYCEETKRRLGREMYTGSATDIAVRIAGESGPMGIVYGGGSSNQYTLVLDNTSLFEGLKEVADFDNMDFYTDVGGNIQWFARQSNTDPSTSFEEGLNIFSYRYLRDVSDVKNDVYVLGSTLRNDISGSYFPLNEDYYTESISNVDMPTYWSGWYRDLTAGITLGKLEISGSAGSIIEVGWPAATGSHYIINNNSFTGSTIGNLNEANVIFNVGATDYGSLILDSQDSLHTYLSYEYANAGYNFFQPYIRLYTGATGSNNYYECLLERLNLTGAVHSDWYERNINLGVLNEGVSLTGSIDSTNGTYLWTVNGHPDWYSINYIDFGVYYNVTGTGFSGFIAVDGMYLKTKFQYHNSHSSSINTWGIRPEVISDTKINSNAYAKSIGDTKLSGSINPTINIELETITRPLVMGTSYPVRIKSENIDAFFELIDLETNWINNKLTTKCLFTNQIEKRIPVPLINYPTQQAQENLSVIQALQKYGHMKSVYL